MNFEDACFDLCDLPDNWKPNWLIESLWQANSINLLFGAPRSRKSTLRGYLMACALAQRPAFDTFAIIQPVKRALLLLAEDVPEAESTRLHQLFATLGVSREEYRGRITLADSLLGFRLDDLSNVRELERYLQVEQHDFLVMDPLINFHRQNENDAAAMAGVLANARSLSRHATVVLLHHESKPGEFTRGRSGSQRARGSTVITGYTASNTRLSRLGHGNCHRLEFDPKLGAKNPKMDILYTSSGAWRAVHLSSEEERVLRYIEGHSGLSANGVVEGTKMKREVALAAVRQLVTLNLVSQVDGKLHELVPDSPSFEVVPGVVPDPIRQDEISLFEDGANDAST